MRTLILLAGIGQLALALGSLAIPRVLGWAEETRALRPLTRQVFWTYAGYIWSAHVCFGLLSALAPDALLERTLLAGLVDLFIALWWGARLAIQFAWFDRSARPPGAQYVLAEVGLVTMFISCTAIYGAAAWLALRGAA